MGYIFFIMSGVVHCCLQNATQLDLVCIFVARETGSTKYTTNSDVCIIYLICKLDKILYKGLTLTQLHSVYLKLILFSLHTSKVLFKGSVTPIT